jgi:N-acetylneuraminate synthase
MQQPKAKCYVIAEAGVNHNGSLEMALQLIDVACDAGADAVKFQTFKAENLVTTLASKASYQQQTTAAGESQFAMLKRLELSYEAHYQLMKYCQKVGIEFLSTAFDMESLDFLVKDLGLKTLKVSSGEITNAPLLLAHARTGKDLIVSTGMAILDEVESALGVIAYGLSDDFSAKPSAELFQNAYNSDKGQQLLKEKVTILHCTTEYPAPVEDINLNAMHTMRNIFGLRVGYSDHSEGITVPVAAAALGAEVIEKHFTLDKMLEGPDHKASLEPHELKAMVTAIRDVGQALGDGCKEPKESELKNRPIARKSLVAAREIRKGEFFSEENLTVKRPGTGMNPFKFWEILGQVASRDYTVDEVISE